MNDRGTWYMLHTYNRTYEILPESKYDIISLDPGIRTFQTGYNPEGTFVKFGENQIETIKSLYSKIDKVKSISNTIDNNYVFKSKSDKDQSKKIKQVKRNLKRKELKLSKKVYDVTSNLHNQVSSYLTNTFEHIVLPEFNTSQMIQKDIPSRTKRMMNSLSFYKFKMKL